WACVQSDVRGPDPPSWLLPPDTGVSDPTKHQLTTPAFPRSGALSENHSVEDRRTLWCAQLPQKVSQQPGLESAAPDPSARKLCPRVRCGREPRRLHLLCRGYQCSSPRRPAGSHKKSAAI